MRIVVLGASGMLGQALMPEGKKRGHCMIGDRVDITDLRSLNQHLQKHQPDLVINAAAMTDLKQCQADPIAAYQVNAYPVCLLDQYRLVHISSDQAANPVNTYGRSKLAAEKLVRSSNLIVRTNIVGPKNMAWAFDAIEQDAPMTLFSDYFTSSIDIWSFSEIMFDLLEKRPEVSGFVNIASRDTVSKQIFIEALAARLAKRLSRATVGSAKNLEPERTLYNRLEVQPVEQILNRRMPDLNDVINALVERRNQPCINPSPLMAG